MNIEKIDFLVCGAQKSATTFSHGLLSRHPELLLSQKKEIHFFDNDQLFPISNGDYSAYHQYFDFNDDRIKGEITPIYMYWEPCMRRIFNYNPHMKIIISLRNPVERAFSQWRMETTVNKETLNFATALHHEKEKLGKEQNKQHRVYSYVDRGRYYKQLMRILSFFPKQQVQILMFDEIIQSPQKTLDKISQFLEVSHIEVNLDSLDRFSSTISESYNEQIAKDVISELYDDIKQLEKLLKIDLSSWLQTEK